MLRQLILLLIVMAGVGLLLARIPEAWATPPWQLPPATIQRVSVASDGAQGTNSSASPSGSTDGRLVTFTSEASSLVAGDTNRTSDIFIRDRQAGDTRRVSVASDGVQGNNSSSSPSVSAEGRFVAFASEASNLAVGDTNSLQDVFVHDRQTGETRRVSVASDGAQGNKSSSSPSISAEGRFVAFASEALSLVAGDTNGVEDIFVHDRQTGETRRVSVASDGTQGSNSSSSPSISADGRFIIFRSLANNLVPDDNNQTWDIFIVTNPLWVPAATPTPAPPPAVTVAPADGLKPLGDNLVRVWGYDAGTQKFQLYDPAAALLSDLKALNRGQGYWINMKSAQKVTLGTAEYNLVAGWNLIGWLG